MSCNALRLGRRRGLRVTGSGGHSAHGTTHRAQTTGGLFLVYRYSLGLIRVFWGCELCVPHVGWQVQLLLSRFQYDGFPNPLFQAGKFRLEVRPLPAVLSLGLEG